MDIEEPPPAPLARPNGPNGSGPARGKIPGMTIRTPDLFPHPRLLPVDVIEADRDYDRWELHALKRWGRCGVHPDCLSCRARNEAEGPELVCGGLLSAEAREVNPNDA